MAMTAATASPDRTWAAWVATTAANQPAGANGSLSVPSSRSMPTNTKTATVDCASHSDRLKTTLIGADRSSRVSARPMPRSPANTSSWVVAKRSPSSSGASMNESAWLSRPKGMWTTYRSVTANRATRRGHHSEGSSSGREGPRHHKASAVVARPAVTSQTWTSDRLGRVTRALCR